MRYLFIVKLVCCAVAAAATLMMARPPTVILYPIMQNEWRLKQTHTHAQWHTKPDQIALQKESAVRVGRERSQLVSSRKAAASLLLNFCACAYNCTDSERIVAANVLRLSLENGPKNLITTNNNNNNII